jgi:hypothetical protein
MKKMNSYSPWDDPQLSDGDFPQPKQNMKLKKGDILEFDPDRSIYAAQKGAKAIFQRYEKSREGEDYVSVKWIRDELSSSQQDGEYFACMFIKVEEVSSQKEDRIFEENKKVMKFDFKNGKKLLIEYFNCEIERAEQYALEYIRGLDDMDDIESEVDSFRYSKREHDERVRNIELSNTLSQVFKALIDSCLEDDDDTIMSFFIQEINEGISL